MGTVNLCDQSKQVQVSMGETLKVEEDTQGQARHTHTHTEATQAVQNQRIQKRTYIRDKGTNRT